MQVSWTGRGDFTPSSVQLRWESDGGLPPEVIPATCLGPEGTDSLPTRFFFFVCEWCLCFVFLGREKVPECEKVPMSLGSSMFQSICFFPAECASG